MLILNVIGIFMAIPRFFLIDLPLLRGLYDGTHPGTIVMNLVWTLFNMVILGVATAVAWESQQRRQTVRVAMSVPTDVVLADGMILPGVTSDLSSGGVMVHLDEGIEIMAGEAVSLVFPVLDGDATLPATVVGIDGNVLRAQFDPLTLQEEEALTMVLYSRADTWLGWGEAREADAPLKSMLRIVQLSIRGLNQTIRGMLKSKKRAPKGRLATTIAPVLPLRASLRFDRQARPCSGKRAGPVAWTGRGRRHSNADPEWGTRRSCGASGAVRQRLHPGRCQCARYHRAARCGCLPLHLLQRAADADRQKRHDAHPLSLLAWSSARALAPEGLAERNALCHASVTNNPSFTGHDISSDAKIAASDKINVTRSENSALLEATLTLPADMIVQSNELTFEFIGHYTTQCEDPSHSTLWAHVDSNSSIELSGALLPLQNDLKLLPLPFYDAAVNLHPVIPIVFLSQPSPAAMRAAAIITSWFGILTDYRPVHFPVSIGTIPQGNAIVIGENGVLPPALNITASTGPTVAMRTNPGDPYSKLLVLTGDNGDDVVTAAQVLTLQRDLLASDTQSLHNIRKPNPRKPDDAPRWLNTDKITHIGDIAQTGDLQGDGSVPVGTYMRLPPDLYTEPLGNLSFHMGYRYNGIPLADESTLQVYMNGAYRQLDPHAALGQGLGQPRDRHSDSGRRRSFVRSRTP